MKKEERNIEKKAGNESPVLTARSHDPGHESFCNDGQENNTPKAEAGSGQSFSSCVNQENCKYLSICQKAKYQINSVTIDLWF